MKTSAWIALALVFCLWGLPVPADVILLADGSSIEGEVQLERLLLSSSQGEVEVPVLALEKLIVSDGSVQVLLRDGTELSGSVQEETLEVRSGLITRRIPWSQLVEVRVDTARTAVIDDIVASGHFLDVDSLPAESDIVSVPCPLRVRTRLPRRIKEGHWTAAKVRLVECDRAVSIATIMFTFSSRRDGGGRLLVEPHIRVRPPQDKLVDLTMRLEIDGETIDQQRRPQIDAEEGQTSRRRFELTIPAETVSRWAGEAEAFLELEIHAVDH